MATRYFSNFPLVNYNDNFARNILLKSQFFKKIIESIGAFYTYTLKDGERPDTVAFDYYGSSDYTWLVFFSNQIVDPYFDWPLDNLTLDNFLIKKYGSLVEAQSEIAYYTYDPLHDTTDPDYEYNLNYRMDPETYDYKVLNDSTFLPIYWIAKSAYDYEVEKNDDRRNIRLLDNKYLNQVTSEITKIFKK